MRSRSRALVAAAIHAYCRKVVIPTIYPRVREKAPTAQQQVQANRHIREGVRDALTDPFRVFAKRVEHFARHHPERVAEMSRWHAIDEVPYATVMLPGDLNEPFRHRGYAIPPLPTTEAQIDPFLQIYWAHRRQRSATLSPGADDNSPREREDLRAELRRRIDTGERLDPKTWRQYEAVHHAQQDRARKGRGSYVLGRNVTMVAREDNVQFTREHGLFDVADVKYGSFLLSSNSSPYGVVSPTRMPIGRYGVGYSRRLLRTLNFMIDFAEQDDVTLQAICRAVAKYRGIVSTHTLRPLDVNLPGDEEGSVAGLQEGLGSMFSMAILHTAQELDGYEDNPNGAFARVCDDDLINNTIQLAPLAFAFPTMLHGLGFENPNEYRGNKLVCREEFRDKLAYMRELTEALEATAWERYHEQRKAAAEEMGIPEEEVTNIRPPVRSGLPCPFAGAFKNAAGDLGQGAISLLTPAAKTVYNCIPDSDDVDGLGYVWDIPRIEGQGYEPAQSTAVRLWTMRNEGIIRVADPFATVGAPPTDVSAPAARRPR